MVSTLAALCLNISWPRQTLVSILLDLCFRFLSVSCCIICFLLQFNINALKLRNSLGCCQHFKVCCAANIVRVFLCVCVCLQSFYFHPLLSLICIFYSGPSLILYWSLCFLPFIHRASCLNQIFSVLPVVPLPTLRQVRLTQKCVQTSLLWRKSAKYKCLRA